MDNQSNNQNNFLTKLALIDIEIKKLNTEQSIFFIGLSKIGKSTFFNHFFNATLIGEKRGMNIVYALQIDLNSVAYVNNLTISSTTLVPNIHTKTDNSGKKTTTCDLAGLDDKRNYAQVLGVSYSLKKTFQTVKKCKFVFFINHDFVTTALSKLYDSILKFVSIFRFHELSQKQKEQFLGCIVIVMAKSEPGYSVSDYVDQIKDLVTQISDPNYNEIRSKDDKQDVINFLNYFILNPRIQLFQKAIPSKTAPPCQIYQNYIIKMNPFNLKEHMAAFRTKNKISMLNLPFKKDYEICLDNNEKKQFNVKCEQRINSFVDFSKTLIKLLKKATAEKQIQQTLTINKKQTTVKKLKTTFDTVFNQQMDFSSEFEAMNEFNKKYNVYPADFKDMIYAEETQVSPIFGNKDMEKNLDNGIKLAKTIFVLFQLFENTPTYIEEDDTTKSFADWMSSFKNHIIGILKIIRNTFCKNHKEQQILLQFLFIAVRACSEIAVIFEINQQNKNSICTSLKDIFKTVLNFEKNSERKIADVQCEFVRTVCKKDQKFFSNINDDQFLLYKEYILNFKERQQTDDSIKRFILNNADFTKLYNLILKISLLHCATQEQKLYALFINYHQHKNKAKKDFQAAFQQQQDDDANDQEGNNSSNKVIEQNDFIFKSLLHQMATVLLGLVRNGDVKNDIFASEKADEFDNMEEPEIKKALTKRQADLAKNIFTYINDVESVCECYEKILNNLDDNKKKFKLTYLQGFADFLLANGRKQQANVYYQKAIKYSFEIKDREKYNEITHKLIKVPENQANSERDYILKNKRKQNINPTSDQQLNDLIEAIQDNYIVPYENYRERKKIQKEKRQRQMNQNY